MFNPFVAEGFAYPGATRNVGLPEGLPDTPQVGGLRWNGSPSGYTELLKTAAHIHAHSQEAAARITEIAQAVEIALLLHEWGFCVGIKDCDSTVHALLGAGVPLTRVLTLRDNVYHSGRVVPLLNTPIGTHKETTHDSDD